MNKEFRQKIESVIQKYNIRVDFILTEEHLQSLEQVCGNGNIDPKHVKGYIDSINRTTKPPLGLIPRWIWVEHRLGEIYDAILRYQEVNKEIPYDWICEYNEHVNWFMENEPNRYNRFIKEHHQKI